MAEDSWSQMERRDFNDLRWWNWGWSRWEIPWEQEVVVEEEEQGVFDVLCMTVVPHNQQLCAGE